MSTQNLALDTHSAYISVNVVLVSLAPLVSFD